jgi:hypothetical protein
VVRTLSRSPCAHRRRNPALTPSCLLGIVPPLLRWCVVCRTLAPFEMRSALIRLLLHHLTVALVVLGLVVPCPCDHADADESAVASCCTNSLADAVDADASHPTSHEACAHCDDDTYVAASADLLLASILLDEPVIPPPLGTTPPPPPPGPSSIELLREQQQRPPPSSPSSLETALPLHQRISVWLC